MIPYANYCNPFAQNWGSIKIQARLKDASHTKVTSIERHRQPFGIYLLIHQPINIIPALNHIEKDTRTLTTDK